MSAFNPNKLGVPPRTPGRRLTRLQAAGRSWTWIVLLSWLVWCTCPRASSAQPAALGLYVDPAVLAPASVQAALEAELGMTLELLETPDEKRPTLRVEPLGSDAVRITLEGGDGRRVERDAPLLDHEAQGVETVTFLASNMLHNEAYGLLRELNLTPRDTEQPPPVKLAKDQLPKPEYDPLTAFNACLTPVDGPVGVDFVPGVGMSSTAKGRQSVRAFSFGYLGSYARGVRGFSLSGVVSIQRESLCGLQISGAANFVKGSAIGLQIAPVNLVLRTSGGATLGVLNVIRGEQRGVTIGLGNLVFHSSSGASAGLLNMSLGNFKGFSGGIANLATGNLSGVQAGVANFAGGNQAGAQMGVANVALGYARGVQIGLANVAGKDARVQVGLFNYAEKIRAPVGLVSIVKNGRTDLDLWGPSESGSILVGVSHGGERVHNLYYVGARTGSAGQRFVAALGLGIRAFERRFFRIDVDALSEYIYRNGATKPTFQQGFRVPFIFMVKSGFGIMAAPSYQFFFTEDPKEESQARFGRTVFSGDKTRVEGFPGFAGGVRFELPSASPRAH